VTIPVVHFRFGGVESDAVGMGRPYTVVYDGQCKVCGRLVKLLNAWDKNDEIEVIPFQNTSVLDRFPWIPSEAYAEAMQLIGPGGKTWQGGEAIEQLLKILPCGGVLLETRGVVLVVDAAHHVRGHHVQLRARRHRGSGVGKLQRERRLGGDGDQVYVKVEHVLAAVRPVGRKDVDGAAPRGLAQPRKDALGHGEGARGKLFGNVEQVLEVLLGHHQHVPRVQRLDVEERDGLFVLVDHAHHLVTADDAAEHAGGVLVGVHHSGLRQLWSTQRRPPRRNRTPRGARGRPGDTAGNRE
jgi:predicted DCC family thiol-disulfide oxidoreductase YuxK